MQHSCKNDTLGPSAPGVGAPGRAAEESADDDSLERDLRECVQSSTKSDGCGTAGGCLSLLGVALAIWLQRKGPRSV
jgi:hypothetical protein